MQTTNLFLSSQNLKIYSIHHEAWHTVLREDKEKIHIYVYWWLPLWPLRSLLNFALLQILWSDTKVTERYPLCHDAASCVPCNWLYIYMAFYSSWFYKMIQKIYVKRLFPLAIGIFSYFVWRLTLCVMIPYISDRHLDF